MAKRQRSPRELEDRRLCPDANGVLNVKRSVVADAMREVGRIEPLTIAEVRRWQSDPASAPPQAIAIMAAAAAARAQALAQRQRLEFEAEHRELQLQAHVERRLLQGAERFRDPDAELIASEFAFEAMKWLVRADGDTAGLSELDLAALTWAGVDPQDRDTWFLRAGSGVRREPRLPQQPPSFVRDSASRVWVTKPILRARGWTDAAVRDFLPDPEGFKQNPHYSTAGHPMPAWMPETVAEAEANPAWRRWLESSLRRRKTTLLDLQPDPSDESFRRKTEAVQSAITAYHRAKGDRRNSETP